MGTLLREISLRHLRHAPLRTALVVLGIALGVGMLCAILATNAVLSAAFEEMAERVAGKADLTVAGSGAGIPGTLTGDIAELPGVEHAAATLEIVTRVVPAAGEAGEGSSLLVLGVDFLGDTFFLPFAQDGEQQVVDDPLSFVNDPTAVLVSKKLAKDRNLTVGAPLTLLTSEGPTEFHVRGLLDDAGPASAYGGQVVVMFLDAAQVSFGRGVSVDRIDIVVAEDETRDAVQARIDKLLAGRATVEPPQGRTRRMVGALGSFQNGLNVSGVIALMVGMFLIFNAVSISVAQRRREVGTLRALGVTQRAMVTLFCLEAAMLSVLGTALGLVLGQALAKVALSAVEESVHRLWVPIQPKPPSLTPTVIAWGIAAGIGTTVLAAYLPARSTNRISPAAALRASRSTVFARKLPERRLAALGIVALAIAAVLGALGGEQNGYFAAFMVNVGFGLCVPILIRITHRLFMRPVELGLGIAGRLALDHVERSLGRSATTVIALMLAVGMSTSISGYSHSFEASLLRWADTSFPSDAVISAGASFLDREHVPFKESAIGDLSGIEGLFAVDGSRQIQLNYGGKTMELKASDSRLAIGEGLRKHKRPLVIDGPDPLAVDALYERPRVLLSENAAHYQNLRAGDTMMIETPSGRRAFEVYAVLVDYSTEQGALMIDRRWLREFWQDELVDVVHLYFGEGADPERVVGAVRARLGGAENLFITHSSGIRDELSALTESLFAYARAPEFIALLVAIMGVVGTMLAAILDRVREIGMLRAVGATRRQVTFSLIVESGFMGLTASLCGILGGVPLGLLLVKVVGSATSGWSLQYTFPLEAALRVFALVTLAAAAAGCLPGHRVSRMDVKEALSYE